MEEEDKTIKGKVAVDQITAICNEIACDWSKVASSWVSHKSEQLS